MSRSPESAVPRATPSLAFVFLAGFDVLMAVLYAAAALWVVLNPASGCAVDGVPCIDIGGTCLFLGIGAPVLGLLTLVALGVRQRSVRPRLALALVALPPALLLGWIALPSHATFLG